MPATDPARPWFQTRGIVLSWDDVTTYDWPKLAAAVGLTTISVHAAEPLAATADGQRFLGRCREENIAVEQEQHAMARLLPRGLFESRPELFRLDENDTRTPDWNCCASSAQALDIIVGNAVNDVRRGSTTTGRYYFWLDVSLFSNWTAPPVELPWADGVLQADLATYGGRGIRHVTTFGVNLGGAYFARYPEVADRIRTCGAALNHRRPL